MYRLMPCGNTLGSNTSKHPMWRPPHDQIKNLKSASGLISAFLSVGTALQKHRLHPRCGTHQPFTAQQALDLGPVPASSQSLLIMAVMSRALCSTLIVCMRELELSIDRVPTVSCIWQATAPDNANHEQRRSPAREHPCSLLRHLAEGGVGGEQLIVGALCDDVPLLHEVDDVAVLHR